MFSPFTLSLRECGVKKNWTNNQHPESQSKYMLFWVQKHSLNAVLGFCIYATPSSARSIATMYYYHFTFATFFIWKVTLQRNEQEKHYCLWVKRQVPWFRPLSMENRTMVVSRSSYFFACLNTVAFALVTKPSWIRYFAAEILLF